MFFNSVFLARRLVMSADNVTTCIRLLLSCYVWVLIMVSYIENWKSFWCNLIIIVFHRCLFTPIKAITFMHKAEFMEKKYVWAFKYENGYMFVEMRCICVDFKGCHNFSRPSRRLHTCSGPPTEWMQFPLTLSHSTRVSPLTLSSSSFRMQKLDISSTCWAPPCTTRPPLLHLWAFTSNQLWMKYI